jgi:hypothetical protein
VRAEVWFEVACLVSFWESRSWADRFDISAFYIFVSGVKNVYCFRSTFSFKMRIFSFPASSLASKASERRAVSEVMDAV